MIHTSKVLVIVGSVRDRRICPAIAAWVAGIGGDCLGAAPEVLDLKDWRLPMDDEPGLPAAHPYERDHTRAFSAKIAQANALVFVAPQYNWGYPAVLKNALDHLYAEWSGKPAMIVTYGSRGGGKCARQLRQVLKGLHMRPVATMPGLKLTKDRIKANPGAIDAKAVFGGHAPAIRRAYAQLATALKRPAMRNWLRWW